MLRRYIGFGLLAATTTFVISEVMTVAFKDLPEVKKMMMCEKPDETTSKVKKELRAIKLAVKKRVRAIKSNPRTEVIVPMKVMFWGCAYFCLGHNIGYNAGLFEGAKKVGNSMLSFLEEVTPEQFKPLVRAVLDKGINKSVFFKNVQHGFFKDTVDSCSLSWDKLWASKYAEEVAKIC